MRKPLFELQYDPNDRLIPSGNIEKGLEQCAKLTPEEITDADMRLIFAETEHLSLKQTLKWIVLNREGFSKTTYLGAVSDNGNRLIPPGPDNDRYHTLVIQRPLHTIFELDRFLANANEKLVSGGYLYCNARTTSMKRQLTMRKYPWGISHIISGWDYVWHRICPKLCEPTRKLYFFFTNGKNRSFHRVEILGRLYRAGFEVLNENTTFGEYRVLARKVREPIVDDTPSGSPIVKLNRVGKDGKLIGVYKFRSMYSYSEYIQGYVYTYNHLDSSGKFANDFRVNFWGKFLRKVWLDELPMVVNILKGQMKLVGVRPLSRHFFSLYTKEMQELRVKAKPGLLPPFYYEEKSPETLEEIQESERRYTEAYLKHPFLTDWRYFWGIFRNIVFKRKKSH